MLGLALVAHPVWGLYLRMGVYLPHGGYTPVWGVYPHMEVITHIGCIPHHMRVYTHIGENKPVQVLSPDRAVTRNKIKAKYKIDVVAFVG